MKVCERRRELCAQQCAYSAQTSVFAFPVKYIGALPFRLHTLPLWLWLDKEVTDSIRESSLFQPVYKNNSLDLKGKRKKHHFLSLAEEHPKEAVSFFYLNTTLPLAHTHTHICVCRSHHAHTYSSSAAEIWLLSTWLHRSQSERIADSTLLQTFSLSLASSSQLSMTPTDFTREHSKGLL